VERRSKLAPYDDRLGLGRRGEQLAADYLVAKGYRLLEKNWRCQAGELDIVAQDGETLVAVEVRTRRGRSLGSPEESITLAKQLRLVDLSETYVQETDWSGPLRIDVVAVVIDRRGQVQRLDHYENAIVG
jgi:putative endonuclease